MVLAVQVAEDTHGNLLHLLSEIENGRSTNPTAFVHTEHGVQSTSTGFQRMQGNVRHRFTGTFDGNKEDYVRAAHSSSYNGKNKKRALERTGVKNLKKGFGTVLAVGTLGATVLNGVQLCHLWNKFSADGILTQEELVRMGVEMTEFRNIPGAVKEIYTSATQDGVDLLNAAEVPAFQDRMINGAIDGMGPSLDVEAGGGIGEGLAEASGGIGEGLAEASGGIGEGLVEVAGAVLSLFFG